VWQAEGLIISNPHLDHNFGSGWNRQNDRAADLHTEGREAETPAKPQVSRRQPKSGKIMGRWRSLFRLGI
jgi:hypothetical protein